MASLFSLPTFFIFFRETTEAAVIVSVLLSFARRIYNDDPENFSHLRKQIWLGTGLGILASVMIGAIFITLWYTLARNFWSSSEALWEGIFAVLSSLIITMMALAMLKTSQLQQKWRQKLSEVLNLSSSTRSRHALLFLPFITVLREGLEGVVFLGGVAITEEVTAIPIAAICGILCGLLVGYVIYRGGNILQIHWFFVVSTCFLLLVAAGLFSRGIGLFENYVWQQQTGALGGDEAGEAIFNVATNIWFLDCCRPDGSNGGWALFHAVFGWNNVASIATVTAYIAYWLFVIVTIFLFRRRDRVAKPHPL